MSSRFKNRLISSILSRLPSVVAFLAPHLVSNPKGDSSMKMSSTDNNDLNDTDSNIPWTPLKKPLSELKVALITTAGVHLSADEPFDMYDAEGDATFRAIPSGTDTKNLKITHDYYDHSDADKDVNIVLPIERLRELAGEGVISEVATSHYGFMGHIVGGLVDVLINESAPKVLRRLKEDKVDVVILSPG
ncbi:MAG: hypothetical protein KAT46_05040 [Deltaproteobacteria bacterium]|nr:hypothetical protein [Deltaproteobacteria bacterium]